MWDSKYPYNLGGFPIDSHVSQNQLLKQSGVVQMEILMWSYLYSARQWMRAPKKFYFTNFSYYKFYFLYINLFINNISFFALCSNHTIFIFVNKVEVFLCIFFCKHVISIWYYSISVFLVPIKIWISKSR